MPGISSNSTATSFLKLLDRAAPEDGRARIAGARVACIGPITAATAKDNGLRVDVVPDTYTIPALVDAVVARGGGPKPGEEVV